MADEEIEVEGKKKSPLIKIIIIAVVAILLLAGTAVGTMFVTGFFDKKDTSAAEEALKKSGKRGHRRQRSRQRRNTAKSGQRVAGAAAF